MNFLEMLYKGAFKDPFYKPFIPMFPLAVAWMSDLGFFNTPSGLFFPLALLSHTVQIAAMYFVRHSLLAWLVYKVIETRRGTKTLFFVYNSHIFTLIVFALLGVSIGAAALGAPGKIAAVHPALQATAGINFLWYVAAFLFGNELLRLLLMFEANTGSTTAAQAQATD